ncbi:uncharacterized protein LOC143294607 [Babylonia areolata]|uniref:uncharacterized protein LOC143294607 n=1 Tax=Babylonia areolata TaxID=304850 RepID=UPI003FD2D46A
MSEVLQLLLDCNSLVVSSVIIQCLDIVLSERFAFLSRMEVLSKVNLIVESADFAEKEKCVQKDSCLEKLKQMFQMIFDIGDYEFQVCIMEFLFRLLPRKLRQKYSSHLIEDSDILRTFLALKDSCFEVDCRKFLNHLNRIPREEDRKTALAFRVCSFPCQKITLGPMELQKPCDEGYTDFWLDVNLGSRRLVIFCENAHLSSQASMSEDCWDTVSVWFSDVHKFVCHEEGGVLHSRIHLKATARCVPRGADCDGRPVLYVVTHPQHNLQAALGRLFSHKKVSDATKPIRFMTETTSLEGSEGLDSADSEELGVRGKTARGQERPGLTGLKNTKMAQPFPLPGPHPSHGTSVKVSTPVGPAVRSHSQEGYWMKASVPSDIMATPASTVSVHSCASGIRENMRRANTFRADTTPCRKKVKTPVVTVKKPVTAPAKTDTRVASPDKMGTTVTTPAKMDTGVASPGKMNATMTAPAKMDKRVASPGKTETRLTIPKKQTRTSAKTKFAPPAADHYKLPNEQQAVNTEQRGEKDQMEDSPVNIVIPDSLPFPSQISKPSRQETTSKRPRRGKDPHSGNTVTEQVKDPASSSLNAGAARPSKNPRSQSSDKLKKTQEVAQRSHGRTLRSSQSSRTLPQSAVREDSETAQNPSRNASNRGKTVKLTLDVPPCKTSQKAANSNTVRPTQNGSPCGKPKTTKTDSSDSQAGSDEVEMVPSSFEEFKAPRSKKTLSGRTKKALSDRGSSTQDDRGSQTARNKKKSQSDVVKKSQHDKTVTDAEKGAKDISITGSGGKDLRGSGDSPLHNQKNRPNHLEEMKDSPVESAEYSRDETQCTKSQKKEVASKKDRDDHGLSSTRENTAPKSSRQGSTKHAVIPSSTTVGSQIPPQHSSGKQKSKQKENLIAEKKNSEVVEPCSDDTNLMFSAEKRIQEDSKYNSTSEAKESHEAVSTSLQRQKENPHQITKGSLLSGTGSEGDNRQRPKKTRKLSDEKAVSDDQGDEKTTSDSQNDHLAKCTKTTSDSQNDHLAKCTKATSDSQNDHRAKCTKTTSDSQNDHRAKCTKTTSDSQNDHRAKCTKTTSYSQNDHRAKCTKTTSDSQNDHQAKCTDVSKNSSDRNHTLHTHSRAPGDVSEIEVIPHSAEPRQHPTASAGETGRSAQKVMTADRNQTDRKKALSGQGDGDASRKETEKDLSVTASPVKQGEVTDTEKKNHENDPHADRYQYSEEESSDLIDLVRSDSEDDDTTDFRFEIDTPGETPAKAAPGESPHEPGYNTSAERKAQSTEVDVPPKHDTAVVHRFTEDIQSELTNDEGQCQLKKTNSSKKSKGKTSLFSAECQKDNIDDSVLSRTHSKSFVSDRKCEDDNILNQSRSKSLISDRKLMFSKSERQMDGREKKLVHKMFTMSFSSIQAQGPYPPSADPYDFNEEC